MTTNLKCSIKTCNFLKIKNWEYFSLPTDPILSKKWLDEIGTDHLDQSTDIRICSLHFRKRNIWNKDGTCTLVPDTIPLINLPRHRHDSNGNKRKLGEALRQTLEKSEGLKAIFNSKPKPKVVINSSAKAPAKILLPKPVTKTSEPKVLPLTISDGNIQQVILVPTTTAQDKTKPIIIASMKSFGMTPEAGKILLKHNPTSTPANLCDTFKLKQTNQTGKEDATKASASHDKNKSIIIAPLPGGKFLIKNPTSQAKAQLQPQSIVVTNPNPCKTATISIAPKSMHAVAVAGQVLLKHPPPAAPAPAPKAIKLSDKLKNDLSKILAEKRLTQYTAKLSSRSSVPWVGPGGSAEPCQKAADLDIIRQQQATLEKLDEENTKNQYYRNVYASKYNTLEANMRELKTELSAKNRRMRKLDKKIQQMKLKVKRPPEERLLYKYNRWGQLSKIIFHKRK